MANRRKFVSYPADFYVQNSSDSLAATELSLELVFLVFSLLIYIADILTGMKVFNCGSVFTENEVHILQMLFCLV